MLERRDVINFLAKFISFFINLIITFVVSSFVIDKVGSEAYGFVGLANEFVGYAQIVTIAINSMAARFITVAYEKNNNNDVNKFSSSLFFANVLISVCIGTIGGIIIVNLPYVINIANTNVQDVKVLWSFILLNFIVSLIGTVFQVATFCKRRLELEAIRNVISLILKAIILITFYLVLPPYIWYIGFATVLSTIYTLFYNIKYTKRLMPELVVNRRYFDIKTIILLCKSGGWNSLTQLGSVLSSGLDLLITNLFVGTTAMGLLSVAKTVPKYIFSLVSNQASSFAPNFVISVAKNNDEKIIEQLRTSIKILSLFTIIPLVLLTSLGNNIYNLWVPSLSSEKLNTIAIVASIGYLAVMPFESVWMIYTAYNKVKISSIYLLIESFSNIIVELILIQFVTDDLTKVIIIVGITSVLMYIRAIVFFPKFTSKITGRNCNFFYSFLLKNTIIYLLLSIIGKYIMRILNNYSLVSLLLGGVVVGSVSLIVCLYVIYDKEERSALYSKLKKRFRR